jgi:hypothetical protein
MAKKRKIPPLPPEAEPFIRDIIGFVLSGPLASILLEGDAIENLGQLRESHALALFRRIQSQSATFTEADRQELMDLAGNAVNGGFVIDTLQGGIRLGANNREKGANARKGRRKKASDWQSKVDELAPALWVDKPIFIGNFSKTAAEIHPQLRTSFPKAPGPGSVAKYLSRKNKVQEICSSN